MKMSSIEQNDDRIELITIDVTNVINSNQLHSLLKKNLDFPDFYGMNWDAFWDAITGLVEMPKRLILIGWENVEKTIPNDAGQMKNLLNKLNEKHPSWSCEVEYK